MGASTDERIRRLLRREMEKRAVAPAALGVSMEATAAEVEEHLTGSDALDVAWVERAVVALGMSAADFFRRLYEPESGEGTEDSDAGQPTLPREEVDGLVTHVRDLLRATVDLLDGEGEGASGDPGDGSGGRGPVAPGGGNPPRGG